LDEQVLYYVGRAGHDDRKQRQLKPFGALLGALDGSAPSDDVLGSARAIGNDRAGRLYRALGLVLLYGAFPAFALARGFAPPQNPAVVGLNLAVTSLALDGVYAKVMAFQEHAKQYGRVGTIFSNARRCLSVLLAAEDVDAEGVRSLLRDLGREAIAESGAWLLLHRERPLELPRT
jgi:hypothetical protein